MNTTLKTKLVVYEWRVLEALEQKYKLNGRLINGFGQSFVDLRGLCKQATQTHDRVFRAGRIVLMALTNHAHLLLVGGLRSLEDGNGVVWSSCVRGLMEVFGACALIDDKRSFASTLLDHVKPGRLYFAAERSLPGLASDIKRLNEIVHPGPRAILSGHRMADANTKHAEFTYGLVGLSQREAQESVTVLANMAFHIVEKLNSIVLNGATFQEGKIIMRETGKRKPPRITVS
jgi:hypothetical protein